jgi:hypothetical protein
MESMQNGDELVFLYQLVDGYTNTSYACHIAALAGISDDLVQRGHEVYMGFFTLFIAVSPLKNFHPFTFAISLPYFATLQEGILIMCSEHKIFLAFPSNDYYLDKKARYIFKTVFGNRETKSLRLDI